MKLTAKQLRRVINEEANRLAEAPKKRQTGRKNPSTGHGIAKNKRFLEKFAVHIASNIDEYIDDTLRQTIDSVAVNILVEKVMNDLHDELGARPETAEELAKVSPTTLEAAVVKSFNDHFGIDQLLHDIVMQVVEAVIAEADNLAYDREMIGSQPKPRS